MPLMLKSILLSYCCHWNLHSLMNGMGIHNSKQKGIKHWWYLICIFNLHSNIRWWWRYDNRTEIGVNELFPLLPSIGIAKFRWTKQRTCHQCLYSLFVDSGKRMYYAICIYQYQLKVKLVTWCQMDLFIHNIIYGFHHWWGLQWR